MINVNQLAIRNQFGNIDPVMMESALVAALSLTPYVRFIDENTGVRKYFFDIIRATDPLLQLINEVYPINIDAVKESAFNVFIVRYNEVIYANPAVVLNTESNLHKVFLTNTKVIPEASVVNPLLKTCLACVQTGAK